MVRREDRIEDVDRMEEAHEQLVELDGEYDADFGEAAELIEDVLSEEPEQSATMTYRQAYIQLENVEDEADLDNEDKSVVSGIKQALNEETDRYPATGTERHYNLDERRKNL